jgi:hypothetical protein
MTLGQEILRAFLLTFGMTEIITNITYLTKENGLNLARKQHGELPQNISYKKIRLKVICMLSFGIVFFAVSLSTYILYKYFQNIILIISILFSIYGIIEALYYRYWKTFGFAFVTILLVIASILI